jgi:hypothetical protein
VSASRTFLGASVTLAAGLGLALAGCTHREHVRMIPSHLVDRPITVTLRDGRRTIARTQTTRRGVVWLDGRGVIIPRRYVRRGEVTEVSHARGAIEGLSIGFAFGASFGFLAGATIGGSDQIALRAAVALGGIVGVIGLLAGASAGADLIYQIDAPGGPELRPGGPPGSAVGATLAF